jgi:hypothetical protein
VDWTFPGWRPPNLCWQCSWDSYLHLQRPVAGIGFQLEPDGGAVSATVQIFDSMHRLISSLTRPPLGGVCSPSCNDATFYGFYDHAGHIASVSITPNNGGGVAVNQFSIISQPRLSFAGMPRQINCYDQSIAALTNRYGEIQGEILGAATALGVLQRVGIAACHHTLSQWIGEKSARAYLAFDLTDQCVFSPSHCWLHVLRRVGG